MAGTRGDSPHVPSNAPAGRYLEIRPTSTGFYNIDFNAAFNPTCAYNASYDCPYPPPSNRLKVEIKAGEKAPGA